MVGWQQASPGVNLRACLLLSAWCPLNRREGAPLPALKLLLAVPEAAPNQQLHVRLLSADTMAPINHLARLLPGSDMEAVAQLEAEATALGSRRAAAAAAAQKEQLPITFQQPVPGRGGQVQLQYGATRVAARHMQLWASFPAPGEYIVQVGNIILAMIVCAMSQLVLLLSLGWQGRARLNLLWHCFQPNCKHDAVTGSKPAMHESAGPAPPAAAGSAAEGSASIYAHPCPRMRRSPAAQPETGGNGRADEGLLLPAWLHELCWACTHGCSGRQACCMRKCVPSLLLALSMPGAWRGCSLVLVPTSGCRCLAGCGGASPASHPRHHCGPLHPANSAAISTPRHIQAGRTAGAAHSRPAAGGRPPSAV